MTRNGSASMSSAPMTAFLMGSLLGVAAGLLFAPKTGKESREMIKNAARENYNKMQDSARRGKEAAVSSVNTAIDKTKGAINRGQHAADDTKVQLDSARPRNTNPL